MIPHHSLGKTDLKVSCLGLGTVKFGRNEGVRYPQSFELPSEKEMQALLETAENLGINLLDTAPAYGESESRLGRLLKNSREKWVVSTKVGEEFYDGKSFFDFSAATITSSIDRSLKRLHTDFLDIVLIHSNGEDEKIIDSGIFETLNKIKESGKIRAVGMSSKTISGGLLATDFSDVMMVTLNLADSKEKVVIDYAHQKNKGIFIKKALMSGHLSSESEDPVYDSLKFVYQHSGISSVILGTINQNHLIHNVDCVKKIWKSI